MKNIGTSSTLPDPTLHPRTEVEIMASWNDPKADPVVSICCSTYNHETYLADTLSGFLDQITDFAFEIIVHDDASDDGAQALLKTYRDTYPGIIRLVLQDENQWQQGYRLLARQVFSHARGSFIALCDGDDVWSDPKKLQKQIDFLQENREYVLCYGDAEGFTTNSNEKISLAGRRSDLSAKQLQATASIFTLTACFRNVIEDWPDELMKCPYGDQAMWALLGDHGAGKYLASLKTCRQRIHEAGVHSKVGTKQRLLNSLNTNLRLAVFRLERGENYLALAHLQNLFVLSIRMFGSAFFTGLIQRTVEHLQYRFAGRGS